MERDKIAKLIIHYYTEHSSSIASKAHEAFKNNNPEIELYDEDFYYNHLNSDFDSHNRDFLIAIITEQKHVLDDLMLKAYRKA